MMVYFEAIKFGDSFCPGIGNLGLCDGTRLTMGTV